MSLPLDKRGPRGYLGRAIIGFPVVLTGATDRPGSDASSLGGRAPSLSTWNLRGTNIMSENFPRVIGLDDIPAQAGDWLQRRIDQDDADEADKPLVAAAVQRAQAEGSAPGAWVEATLRAQSGDPAVTAMTERALEATDAYYHGKLPRQKGMSAEDGMLELLGTGEQLRGHLKDLVSYVVNGNSSR